MKLVDLARSTAPRKDPLARLSHEEQVRAVNRLFMACNSETCARLKRDLDSKRRGYYRQDALKGRASSVEQVIAYDELVEHLVASKLVCTYCKRGVLLFYPSVRDPLQWTLDRLDNSLAHTRNNTCVSCLECNLQRRRRSHEAFAFTKALSVVRVGSP